jgi:hypothetical protein
MPVPKSDGFATDFYNIPRFTAAWPSGNGQSPFNTTSTVSQGPGQQGSPVTDEVRAPEVAEKPARKTPRRTTTRKSS